MQRQGKRQRARAGCVHVPRQNLKTAYARREAGAYRSISLGAGSACCQRNSRRSANTLASFRCYQEPDAVMCGYLCRSFVQQALKGGSGNSENDSFSNVHGASRIRSAPAAALPGYHPTARSNPNHSGLLRATPYYSVLLRAALCYTVPLRTFPKTPYCSVLLRGTPCTGVLLRIHPDFPGTP
eukprot:gene15911-biopygen17218